MQIPASSESMRVLDPITELRRENSQLRYLVGSVIEELNELKSRLDDLEGGPWLDSIPGMAPPRTHGPPTPSYDTL